VVRELERRDVALGGVWNASPGLWQRYDVPWDGVPSGPGSAKLVGSIGAVYGTPSKYDITIYRVTTDRPRPGRRLDRRVAVRRRAAVRRPEPGHLPARRAGVAADPRPVPPVGVSDGAP
jgi:hypothetical protein